MIIVDEFGVFLTAKLFADDVKIYVVIDGPSKINCLQLGLDKLHLWSVKWQLNIAAHKCCVLHVGRNNIKHEYNIPNSKLVNATEVVDLGVTVDSNMRFDKHTLCSKTSDAKIQITITTAYLIRIKYPFSSFNCHLSDVNVANFNQIHRTVFEQQLF